MEVILNVLEGAKKGAKIAVKKSEFLIGRGQKCHLCAGSSAISRQHCMISRGEKRLTVKDLGSRNGTLVNGAKIAEEVELKSGDELVVGPLKFLVTISAGINNEKKPQVKSVAEAVERAAASDSSDIAEDDISKWLLGSNTDANALSETKTLLMDETSAVGLSAAESAEIEAAGADAREAVGADSREDAAADESSDAAESSPASEERIDEPVNGAKAKKPKGPGKLPHRPPQNNPKDSQAAAEEALRNWNRRR